MVLLLSKAEYTKFHPIVMRQEHNIVLVMRKNNNKNIKESFGKRVKYYRKLRGLTQAELAYSLNKTEETISNIERGINSTKFEVINDIAQVLSIDISELFYFAEDIRIKDQEKFGLIKEVIKILNEKDKKYINGLLNLLKNQ